MGSILINDAEAILSSEIEEHVHLRFRHQTTTFCTILKWIAWLVETTVGGEHVDYEPEEYLTCG